MLARNPDPRLTQTLTRLSRRWLPVLALLALLVTWQSVQAAPTKLTMDGDPADWSDTACLMDDGGVDDESSPTRADVTQFCTHIDAGFVYLLMAWDDTGYSGGKASTAGIRLDINGDSQFDFIVLGTLQGSPATLQKYSIGTCPAGACTNANDVCSSDGAGGGPCTGASAAVGSTWDDPFDPFPGHAAANTCGGPNCLTQDGFLEVAIPWTLLGLRGAPGGNIFGDFGSYPSGPAQAPKDTISASGGLYCPPAGGCYLASPTAITLQGLTVGGESDHTPAGLTLVLVLVLLVVTGHIWQRHTVIRFVAIP